MNGWTGKILRVDLTSGTSVREDIPPELLHAYLGGRGLGVRLMRDYYHLSPDRPGHAADFCRRSALRHNCADSCPSCSCLPLTADRNDLRLFCRGEICLAAESRRP